MRIWTCKIGVLEDVELPPGADFPMRKAVERAFEEVTGRNEDFNFSGWGWKELDKDELEVVQSRPPWPGER